VKLSDSYSLLFTSLLGMVYYPKVAALVHDPAQLRPYVRQVVALLVPVTAAGLLIFYFFRRFFIQLFFDETFLQADFLIDYQVLGDFFKMTGLLLSYIINIQARVKFYIATHAAFAALYVLLVYLLIQPFGIEGFTIAHACRYGAFLAFHVFYFRKLLF
ncbi:MAG: hypothetical protein LPK21_11755, partial [Hymenobacteraceae bacterium]|nr:hypothetical protein [Hymenobacteraceae bacterium]